MEDGKVQSGYGKNITSFYGDSNMKVKNYGISKKFHTDFKPEELLAQNGISTSNIVNEIIIYIEENRILE